MSASQMPRRRSLSAAKVDAPNGDANSFQTFRGDCRWIEQTGAILSGQISASVKDDRRAHYWVN